MNDNKQFTTYKDNVSITVSNKPIYQILTDDEIRGEEEVGYYKPVTRKIAWFVPEDSPLRGTRTTKDGTSFVYLFNTDDYKGDLFNAIMVGQHTEAQTEIWQYLYSTGKLIEE